MKKTIAIPDSDETARRKHAATEDTIEYPEVTGGQTSNKTGKHSSAEKLAASRPEFGTSPGAHPKPGAKGNPAADKQEVPSGNPRDKALRQD